MAESARGSGERGEQKWIVESPLFTIDFSEKKKTDLLLEKQTRPCLLS